MPEVKHHPGWKYPLGGRVVKKVGREAYEFIIGSHHDIDGERFYCVRLAHDAEISADFLLAFDLRPVDDAFSVAVGCFEASTNVHVNPPMIKYQAVGGHSCTGNFLVREIISDDINTYGQVLHTETISGPWRTAGSNELLLPLSFGDLPTNLELAPVLRRVAEGFVPVPPEDLLYLHNARTNQPRWMVKE